MSIFGHVRGHLYKYGFAETSERAIGKAITSVFHELLRRRATPSLGEVAFEAAGVYNTARELVAALLPRSVAALPSMLEELAAHEQELGRRRQAHQFAFHPRWAVERETGHALYLLTRLLQPEIVLETGVADGHSSFFFLKALERNGRGTLHSVDIDPSAGGLVSGGERRHWQLHILDGSKRAMAELVATLPALDLFFHDAEHTYWWCRFELEQAYGKLRDGGLLTSDDFDASFAGIDLCKQWNARPTLLVDRRKVFAALWAKGEPAPATRST
jgi:predicted O-methyltransferase YrrM